MGGGGERITKGSDPPVAEWQQGWLRTFPAHFTNSFSDGRFFPPLQPLPSAVCDRMPGKASLECLQGVGGAAEGAEAGWSGAHRAAALAA